MPETQGDWIVVLILIPLLAVKIGAWCWLGWFLANMDERR